MKRRVLWLIALLTASIMDINAVSVTITDGIDNKEVKTKMEKAIARILNEVNAAQASHRNLNFSVMGVNDYVQSSLAGLWNNTPFICTDDEIVERCITTGTGYEVRNIPLLMKPTGERPFNEDHYQEAVISFDKHGNVESFLLTISTNHYMNIIKENKGNTDLRRRQMIINYVEQFRTSYVKKDLKFLNQVFSDDALIITGNVITQKHPEGYMTQKVRYNKQNKKQYLESLRGIFQRNSYIDVKFDSIGLLRHPTNPNFYGVTLIQHWASGREGRKGYSDIGYVFLLWDFKNEDAPKIHVRTWQAEEFKGKKLKRNEVFSFGDFNIK